MAPDLLGHPCHETGSLVPQGLSPILHTSSMPSDLCPKSGFVAAQGFQRCPKKVSQPFSQVRGGVPSISAKTPWDTGTPQVRGCPRHHYYVESASGTGALLREAGGR